MGNGVSRVRSQSTTAVARGGNDRVVALSHSSIASVTNAPPLLYTVKSSKSTPNGFHNGDVAAAFSSIEKAAGMVGGTVPQQRQETGSSSPSADDDSSPIPLTNGGSQVAGYATLNDIFGEEGKTTTKYIKRRTIGNGAYGEAFLVERNAAYQPSPTSAVEVQVSSNTLARPTQPGGFYVAKVMDLRAMAPQDRQYAQTEVMCLAHTNHFSIIKYYEHYILDCEDETVVIVTEFADHGDLHRNLSRPVTAVDPTGVEAVAAGSAAACPNLSEREAGTYFVQLLLALHHIHSRRMIHRDLKSANLLVTSRGFLKLGDFGFSQKYESTVSSESIAGTFLGTPYYVSPEMWLGRRYGKKADIWAAGVVLYEMLTGGKHPFEADSLPALQACVVESNFIPPTQQIGSAEGAAASSSAAPVSSEMLDILTCMLMKDPEQRPSTEELLRRPIMKQYLHFFEKHVAHLIADDVEKLAADPQCPRRALNFPDPADRDEVLGGIEEGLELIAKESKREMMAGDAHNYTGIVFKDSRNGVWKERYLSLEGETLVISLSLGKEAVNGGERSKRVPLSSMKSVSLCEVEDGHVRASVSSKGYKPPFAFAISMQSSNSIVFGVANATELDNWMHALLSALQME